MSFSPEPGRIFSFRSRAMYERKAEMDPFLPQPSRLRMTLELLKLVSFLQAADYSAAAPFKALEDSGGDGRQDSRGGYSLKETLRVGQNAS